MNKKKKNRIFLLLILLLAITVGFAALATTLKINGNASITKNTWNIYWDNIDNQDGVTPTTSEIVNEDDTHKKNIVNFEVTFEQPGDYYEFTVDAVNAGTIDAEILSIEKKFDDNVISQENPLPSYLKYEVTYEDGSEIKVEDKLAKRTDASTFTRKTYKIRVEYDKDAVTNSDINNQVGDVTHTFDFKVEYGQSSSPSIAKAFNLPQGKTVDNLQVGDEICGTEELGLNDQCFNFIRYDNNDLVMLAKYNLNVGDYAKGTETFKQDSDVRGYCGSGCSEYGTVPFSTNVYWHDGNGLKPEYGSSYPADVYNAVNYKSAPGTDYYSVAYYVETYKGILETAGATIKSARLLTYSEATDPSIGCDGTSWKCPADGFIMNTSFWLGTGFNSYCMWSIYYTNNISNYRWDYTDDIGVRPVIVLSKDNFK